MDMEQLQEKVPLKSCWRATDGVRWTVIGHSEKHDGWLGVELGQTTDARVKRTEPASLFLGMYVLIP